MKDKIKSTIVGRPPFKYPDGLTRPTFILDDKRLYGKIEALAFVYQLTVLELINRAIAGYLKTRDIKSTSKELIEYEIKIITTAIGTTASVIINGEARFIAHESKEIVTIEEFTEALLKLLGGMKDE